MCGGSKRYSNPRRARQSLEVARRLYGSKYAKTVAQRHGVNSRGMKTNGRSSTSNKAKTTNRSTSTTRSTRSNSKSRRVERKTVSTPYGKTTIRSVKRKGRYDIYTKENMHEGMPHTKPLNKFVYRGSTTKKPNLTEYAKDYI